MQKNQNTEIHRKLKLLKKQAAQHLLTPKSKFDFVKSMQAAKTGDRKMLRVKSITRNQCQ